MTIEPPLLPLRRALADDVYDAVLSLLMDQAVQPGSRVSIEGLSRRLLVSPTPVRESLARLEAEGLVTKTAGKGYRAADLLDAEGLRQLFEMRTLLEPFGARLAASRIDPAALAELESLVDVTSEVDSASPEGHRFETFRSFADRDARFHQLIAEQSGNNLLSEAVLRLRSHMHLYRLYFKNRIAEETANEHGLIVDALRKHDPEAAERAMQHHIEHSFDRMAARVD